MSSFWVQRSGATLVAADETSQNCLAELPEGKILKADVKLTRNAGRHRLFWAICHRIGAATGQPSSAVADLLKIDAGHCHTIRSKRHGLVKLPKSIAWSRMDETAFQPFLEACIRAIYEEWGISRPELLSAVQDLLEPKTEARNG